MKRLAFQSEFPIKPLQSLLSVPPLKLALTAKCFIYRVVCWALFIISLIINILQSKIRSIEALPFLKKLVFRVGKKRWQTDKLYCNFLVACRLVRIAIVLGCVG